MQARVVSSGQRVAVCCASPTVSGFSRVHASPARSLHWFRSYTKRGPNVACHLEANAPHQLGRRHEWATLVHTERQRHRGMDGLLGGRASVAAPGTFAQGHAPADQILRQPGRGQSSSGEGTWGVMSPGRAYETGAANVGEQPPWALPLQQPDTRSAFNPETCMTETSTDPQRRNGSRGTRGSLNASKPPAALM